MKINKSDWINHTIAFLGTVIGILIALQPDDWREKKELQERIEIAFSNVYHRLNANRLILSSFKKLKSPSKILLSKS